MYDKSLRLTLLPAELIVKNFVKGEEKCNYECYLLELVNKSSFFKALSHGQSYTAPKNERHGECDCISDSYLLDFKLIGGKTPLQARKLLTSQKDLLAEGAFAIGPPWEKKNTRQVTLIHAALRDYSYSQLVELRKQNPKKQGIENDVCQFLKTLETKKNLLLFFPYFFSFDAKYEIEEVSKQICSALNSDFSSAMEYRHNEVTGFDTFLCFIYSEHLVFLKNESNAFRIVDYVRLNESPTYMRLSDYAEDF